jgi:hypothetical protein
VTRTELTTMPTSQHELMERTSRTVDRPENMSAIAASCWTITEGQRAQKSTDKGVTSLDFGNQSRLYDTADSPVLVAQIDTVTPPEIGLRNLPPLRASDVADVATGHNSETASVTEQALTKAGILPDSTDLLNSLKAAQNDNGSNAVKRDLPPAQGYAEPPAEAATKKDHWNPSKGDLNPLDPSSWSKLQMYAGDVGRANGWDGHHQFEQINALRHALASAYVTFIGGASAAMLAGDWHELHTSIDDMLKGKPWSGNSQDMKDWKDHGIDINNNRAGAKIAQEIKDKGGSWQDVEKAIVDAIKHRLGKDGKLKEPDYPLHTFLGTP